jgi:cysteine desulfurase
MTEHSIYLDYAATTPADPRVIEAMLQCLGPDSAFANPASTHSRGLRAKAKVEHARGQIAARVGATPDEIVFTSGATESNNLALKGVFDELTEPPGERLVTTRIEHKSVLDAAKTLVARGAEVEYVATDENGVVSQAALAAALGEPVRLVSIMHVNNEIGTVQDIEQLAQICHSRGALLHVDAAQSVGKVPLALDAWGVDLCSLTAHKIYGPKGIGALYVRRGTRLHAQIHGGAQERGLRSGTLATHQIVGMGLAYELADPAVETPRIEALSARLWGGLAEIGGTLRNGSAQTGIAHVVNVCFPGVEGESLRLALADIAVSAGSACNSAVPEPSYVLKSIGRSDALAASSLRFSLGRFTTEAEIEYALGRVAEAVGRLRALAGAAPAWCSV